MVDRAQKGTSCWQGSLRASGGDAKFEKTFWNICFIWRNGNWCYKTKDETIGELYMLGPNNEQLKITKLDPSEPVKAVSITQLVDGCMASQLEEMFSKIEDFGTAFHDGWVPRRYAWLGLRSTIWPSLSYPLAACSFSKAKADYLMSALYKLIFPNVYCFAPLSLQELEAPNFHVEQGIRKVSKLLTHGDSSNLTSDLIAVSMEQAQLEVSIGTPLLQAPFDQYGMLCTQCWVKGIWQFTSEHHILLENPTYHTPPLQCEGNEYIMECLVLMDYYGNADLIHINRCQIRKQVLTMSDIICGDWVYLRHDAHTFIPMLQPPSKYDWANKWPSTLTGICGRLPSRS